MKSHVTLIGSGSYGQFAQAALADFDVEFSQLGGRETVEGLKDGTFSFADHPSTHIYIATPNFTHYPLVKAALEAGKHVLCEKPLALDLREIEELYDIAEEQGVYLGVGFVLPNHPFYGWLKEALAQYGGIDWIEVHNHATEGELEPDWYWDPKLSGGWFMVAEIHWLQLYFWLYEGEPYGEATGLEEQKKGRTVTAWVRLADADKKLRLGVHHKLDMTQQTHWAKVEIRFKDGTQWVIDDWVPRSLVVSDKTFNPQTEDYIKRDGQTWTDTRLRDDIYKALIRDNLNKLLKGGAMDKQSVILAHKAALEAQTKGFVKH